MDNWELIDNGLEYNGDFPYNGWIVMHNSFYVAWFLDVKTAKEFVEQEQKN